MLPCQFQFQFLEFESKNGVGIQILFHFHYTWELAMQKVNCVVNPLREVVFWLRKKQLWMKNVHKHRDMVLVFKTG